MLHACAFHCAPRYPALHSQLVKFIHWPREALKRHLQRYLMKQNTFKNGKHLTFQHNHYTEMYSIRYAYKYSCEFDSMHS